MATSIRISSLDQYPVIRSQDFIPIVQSGSGTTLTTYRTPVSSFGNWMAASGSALSSSHAISSSYAISCSWSDRGGYSISSSFLIYPNNSTASNALRSPFADYSTSSSWASSSIFSSASLVTISSSYSRVSTSSSYSRNSETSSLAITASYFNFSIPQNVPPFATSSLSSSWASSSLSSSVAITASYALTASYISSVSPYTYPYISNLYMVASVDDAVNFNFIGVKSRNYEYANTIAWFITGHSGAPAFAQVMRFDFDTNNGIYIAQENGITTGVAVGPSPHALMFADNRGGGPFAWYIIGNIYVTFALAPGKTVLHTYFTNNGAGSYAGLTVRISAWRAALGLSALFDDGNLTGGIISYPFGIPVIT